MLKPWHITCVCFDGGSDKKKCAGMDISVLTDLNLADSSEDAPHGHFASSQILLELLPVSSEITGFMVGSCKPSLWCVGISWDFFVDSNVWSGVQFFSEIALSIIT